MAILEASSAHLGAVGSCRRYMQKLAEV